MTDTDQSCRCGRPTRNTAYSCDTCADELFKALGDVPWLDDELETTTTKVAGIDYRRVGGGKGGKKPAERPSPVSWGASDARAHLRALLVSWVKFCSDSDVRNSSPYPGLPNDTLPAMSRWLMWRVDGLTLHDIGPDAIEEITDAVAACHRVIDRPPDREFYGPCECGRDLYAFARSRDVKCNTCGRTYDGDQMTAWLRAQMDGRLMTLKEAFVVLDKMDLPVPLETLKTWAKDENKLKSAGVNLKGVAVYRIEELMSQASRRVPRTSRKAV